MKFTSFLSKIISTLSAGAAFAIALSPSLSFAQGGLTPSGAPAPTMKTLAQVEPRTPISSLPFTITNAGSYFLTTNLAGNPGGININTNGVTIDLMGFELVGGTGAGISVSGSRTNIVVRNGILRNWAGYGVDCGTAVNGQIIGIVTTGNGSGGGFAGGIQAGAAFSVRECNAFTNVYNGIRVGIGSVIENCIVRANGGDGIGSDFQDVTFRNNTVTGNGANGIRANFRNVIVDNTCVANGFTSGTGAGIETGSGDNLLEHNTVFGNRAGIRVLSDGSLIIRNMARGNFALGNYIIAGGNTVGPTNNLISGGIITNTSPWANISY